MNEHLCPCPTTCACSWKRSMRTSQPGATVQACRWLLIGRTGLNARSGWSSSFNSKRRKSECTRMLVTLTPHLCACAPQLRRLAPRAQMHASCETLGCLAALQVRFRISHASPHFPCTCYTCDPILAGTKSKRHWQRTRKHGRGLSALKPGRCARAWGLHLERMPLLTQTFVLPEPLCVSLRYCCKCAGTAWNYHTPCARLLWHEAHLCMCIHFAINARSFYTCVGPRGLLDGGSACLHASRTGFEGPSLACARRYSWQSKLQKRRLQKQRGRGCGLRQR